MLQSPTSFSSTLEHDEVTLLLSPLEPGIEHEGVNIATMFILVRSPPT
jgi:hypothetical protein